MNEELKQLLEENLKLQREQLKITKFMKNVVIGIGSIVLLVLIVICVNLSKLDIQSLNGSLANLNKITTQLSEKDIDLEAVNTLVTNLAELSENANNLANEVEDKIEMGKDIIDNSKENIADIWDVITNKDKDKNSETTEEIEEPTNKDSN